MHSLRRLLLLWPPPPAISSSGAGGRASRAAALSSRSRKTGDDEWDDAWETAWIPDDFSGKSRAPWEIDVHFPNASSSSPIPPLDVDPDTKAFVAEMDERWNERSAAARKLQDLEPPPPRQQQKQQQSSTSSADPVPGGANKAGDEYRSKKQRIHAGLWLKEIEKMEEAKLADSSAAPDDIDRLMDSCAEIFDSGNLELNTPIPSTFEFKTKPDGWETSSKTQEGSVWEISQREEDLLLQEFERRIAFSKFQIASFIKSHIFSRRRPVDGWKYMIEVIGPNSRRGKGSVERLPTLADPSTQPFREEKPAAIGTTDRSSSRTRF